MKTHLFPVLIAIIKQECILEQECKTKIHLYNITQLQNEEGK